jgi:hypothetical protein
MIENKAVFQSRVLTLYAPFGLVRSSPKPCEKQDISRFMARITVFSGPRAKQLGAV